MKENLAREEIDNSYESIVSKLKGSTLYGVPVDVTDMKLMVVSAYFLGQHELRLQHMREREIK